MMDKILVEVYTPAINQAYDVYIPLTLKLYEVEILLTNAIADLSNGYFAASRDTVICNRETGTILDIDMSAQELGLHNGSRLMLI
ncbi:methyltransferase [Paenibacillus sp. N1-5-1-14]|uniref:methyltransferase n=1 Tax=Paenibacillus radicibacter TaxID=2972488 RepID=UPI002158E885|nr:methyltransferase [Paenibacillus radicibacter]MCR8643644.1 methyltransferase [Paenibacillus radicibacter]MCR8644756.1 methyltransferase [Paenibacillus radicibacter]